MSADLVDPPRVTTTTTIETNEGLLENARENGGEVLLVLGSRIDAPVLARVTDRNGSTFELDVAGKKLRMDVHAIVLLVP